MGDLLYDYLQDVFKCQYWSKQLDPKNNLEKEELMAAYFDFTVENRHVLDHGNYKNV